ncbi:MAG: right-handed parallel beta-helix repeat-containing protein [Patescibacteria group bacterium]|nr:right-handed parallel beta-helix repeat-containing protein [Patescibacteria group bacterium]
MIKNSSRQIAKNIWLKAFFLLSFIFIFLIIYSPKASAASGATYYVDFTSGDDANPGTSIDAAWKHCPGDPNAAGISLSKTPQAGDEIIFKGGVVYSGQININWSGTSGNPIVYDGNSSGAWGTGKAIIDGGGTLMFGFKSSNVRSYVEINSFEIRNMGVNAPAPWASGIGINFADTSDHITIAGCYIHDNGYWQNGGSITPQGEGIGFLRTSDCEISGNEITKIGGTGIALAGAQDCVIENNNIHDYITWGIDVAPDHLIASVRNILRGNSIHDIYQYDQNFYGDTKVDPPHTDFIFIRRGGDSDATYARPAGNIVEGNLFYNNIDFTNHGYGGTAMIFLSYADHTIIRNNVFINPHSYITVGFNWTSQGTKFYNNTIYSTRAAGVSLASGGGNDIRNNLIAASGAMTYDNDAQDLLNLQMDYNAAYVPQADRYVTRANPWGNWNFADWQKQGYEAHGLIFSSLDSIKFIDTSEYPLNCQQMDLRLQAGSAAIDAGQAISGFSNDKNDVSRPQGSAWDIGAYEYVSGTITPPAETTPPPAPAVTPPVSGGSSGSGSSGSSSGSSGSGSGSSEGNAASVVPPVVAPPANPVVTPIAAAPAVTNQENKNSISTPATLIGASSATVNQISLSEAGLIISRTTYASLSSGAQTSYAKLIVEAPSQSDAQKRIIANFIQSGTPTTLILGAGERAGSIASFLSAFGRMPGSELDWQDVVKIGNGRWPTQRSATAEARAKINFKIVYGRNPDMNNTHDNAAVTIMAYGLRPAARNINSEKAAIKSFRFIYHRTPATAREWDIVRAIAYSGAKR